MGLQFYQTNRACALPGVSPRSGLLTRASLIDQDLEARPILEVQTMLVWGASATGASVGWREATTMRSRSSADIALTATSSHDVNSLISKSISPFTLHLARNTYLHQMPRFRDWDFSSPSSFLFLFPHPHVALLAFTHSSPSPAHPQTGNT